jgi:ABC-type phosphate transport system substrate-binding protein
MSLGARRKPVCLPRSTRISALALGAVASFALVGSLHHEPAFAGEVADFRIIVHSENPNTSASREALAEAFLKTTTRWPDGESIRPVDQRPDSAVRKVFTERILKRSLGAVRSYWQQRIFSGRDVPPPELESDDAVVRYVGDHRGAIGYVSASTKTGETKVVTLK